MTLDDADIRILRAHAAEADARGLLQPLQLDHIHRRGWLRALAPRAAGGLELPLPEMVRLEEAIAAADGSCGWFVTLCAGAGWFTGLMAPDFARGLLATPGFCIAGSGAATGTATQERGGWRITGTWSFATGAPWATHFTLNARPLDAQGLPLRDADGGERVQAFIVPAASVRLIPEWHTHGLRATASQRYAVDGAWVGPEHAFTIAPPAAQAADPGRAAHAAGSGAAAQAAGPLWRFPFRPLAYATLAANVAGMGRHFVELAAVLVPQRRHPATGRTLAESPTAQSALQAAPAMLEAARRRFYAALDAAWATVAGGGALDASADAAVAAASVDLAVAAREAAGRLFPFCGLHAADPQSDLNRVWRDLHTATQHALLVPW